MAHPKPVIEIRSDLNRLLRESAELIQILVYRENVIAALHENDVHKKASIEHLSSALDRSIRQLWINALLQVLRVESSHITVAEITDSKISNQDLHQPLLQRVQYLLKDKTHVLHWLLIQKTIPVQHSEENITQRISFIAIDKTAQENAEWQQRLQHITELLYELTDWMEEF
ncbi:MAG: hypothetical protein V4629_03820 [Pseudomonadota bacterium]